MAASGREQELLAVHKRELKELQSKIQNLKHGVSKGDKKRKKQVAAEIAILEAELARKQEKELADLLSKKNDSVDDDSLVHETKLPNTDQLTADSTTAEPITSEEADRDSINISKLSISADSNAVNDSVAQRVSKAQKRRNKKAVKSREREEAISQQEVDNLSGARHLETEKLNSILSERGLSIHEVPSDGDCLYKSVEHQLSTLSLRKTSVKDLRKGTADYMLSHKDDFHPFLTDAASGDLMSDAQYEKYCEDIATKPTWGGHVEIQALSHVCKSPIEVIQGDGPSVVAGSDYEQPKLILSYHRHMYGLGEHYNSVIASVKDDEEENI